MCLQHGFLSLETGLYHKEECVRAPKPNDSWVGACFYMVLSVSAFRGPEGSRSLIAKDMLCETRWNKGEAHELC